MNWTGGRLSRHSGNAKGSITQKQKQYFANARSKPHYEGGKRSPLNWSLFESGGTVPGHQPVDLFDATSITFFPAHNHPNHNVFDNTRMEKDHPKGFRSKSSTSAATALEHPSRRRMPLLYNEHLSKCHLLDGPDQEILKSPRESNCRRPNSPVHREDATVRQHEEEESLQSRKRKILSKSDWVGADIQRPLKLKYMTSTIDRKIGKRRRIDQDEKNISAILQPRVPSPFEASKPKSMTRRVIPSHLCKDQTKSGWTANSKSHVRISIGGKHKAMAVISSPSQCKQPSDQFLSSMASTSDVMLLDGEDTSRWYRTNSRGREEQCSNPLLPPLPSSKAGRTYSPQINIYQERYRKHTPHRQKMFPLSIQSEDRFSLSTAGTSARNRHRVSEFKAATEIECLSSSPNSAPSPENLHYAQFSSLDLATPPHFSFAKLRNLDVQRFEHVTTFQVSNANQTGHRRNCHEPSSSEEEYVTNLSRQLSNSTRKLRSVAQDKARKLPHFSSRPQLLHPIPQSSRRPPVLRTTSTENDGSVVAQLGATIPVVPPSQLMDEEAWKTWVSCLDAGDAENQSEEFSAHEISISPGISTVDHPAVRDSLLLPNASEETATAVTQGAASAKQSGHKAELQESKHNDGNRIKKNSDTITQEKREDCLRRESSNPLILDYKKTFLARPRRTLLPPKAVSQPNPDEAWMKFVLSDSIENDEDIPANNVCYPPKTLRALPTLLSPKSSLLVHLSTQSAANTQLNSALSTICSSTSAPPTIIRSTIRVGRNTATSNRSTRGSNPLPSSDPVCKNMAHPSKHPLPFSSEAGPLTSLIATRKITFTKPRRFTMRLRGRSCSPDEHEGEQETVLHYGPRRKVLRRCAQKQLAEGCRAHVKKDIYSLSSSNDDVESIEDV